MAASRSWLPIMSVLFVLSLTLPAFGRPTAMELFPNETLAFGRVAHFRELFDKLQQSSMGRLLADPNIKPLIEHLYGSARDAYAEDAEKEIGLSLEELQRIPQGEFAIGMIARPAGPPTFAVLLDMGEDAQAARKLLERVKSEMVENGADESTESAGDTQLTILRNGENPGLVFFERENTLVACGDVALAHCMVAFWNGEASPGATVPEVDGEEIEEDAADTPRHWVAPLSQNERFVSILRTCRNAGDPPPQIIWFVNPIEAFVQLNRENLGARIVVEVLPKLGLDRVHGVGGSFTFSTDTYEDITHLHVLLDNPRTGVLTLLNLESGDTTPERFVPSEWIDTYMTLHWNASLTYEKLGSLFDEFQGAGAFENNVRENINEEVGIDFRQDVIEQLDGRVSAVFGFSQPVRFNRRSILVAVHVKDEQAARATLKTMLDATGETVEEDSYGGVDFSVITPPPFREMPVEERPFEACFAFMEGCLVFANERQALQQAVATRDGTAERLADALDFKLIRSRIGRSNLEPGLALFNRPEVAIRYLYDLVHADETRNFLVEQRENNRFFSAIDSALNEHPLPAFEVLAKYFAPSGGILYDSSDGLHYYQFSLRRE
jgi:hypothetical protein